MNILRHVVESVFKHHFVIYVSNLCFIISLPVLYLNDRSVLICSTEAETSFNCGAQDYKKQRLCIICYFCLVLTILFMC